MSTPTSNLKQARLDFSVGKWTGSINKNGKPSQTPTKPIELAVPKDIKPAAKAETVETENSDFIVVSSDEEDSESAFSTDTAKSSAAKKDTPTFVARTPRSPAKQRSPKKPTKVQEESSTDVENPGVFLSSKANTRGDTSSTKKVPASIADPKVSVALPELKIKDPKWTKHYGEVRERMGGMAPIHGEMQNRIHEILRVFDDSYEYGPCVGVSRLERWHRAKALGLDPPKEVEQILNTKQGASMPEYSQSVFYGEV